MEQQPANSTYDSNPAARKKMNKWIVITVLTAAIVLGVILYRVIFVIQDVEVSPLENYTKAEVLSICGITENSTYYSVTEEKVRENIENNVYLRLDSFEKVWPNGIKMTITERKPALNIVYKAIQYVTSVDGMVLESYNKLQLDNGCIRVSGLDIRDIRKKSIVTCVDPEQFDTVIELVNEMIRQGWDTEVSEINLSDMSSITILTKDGYTAEIGDNTEFRAKIGTVRAVIMALYNEEKQGGVIVASVPGEAAYRPSN